MNVFQSLRRFLVVITLAFVLMTTSVACGNVTQQDRASLPKAERSMEYGNLARGDTAAGQSFGDWVVKTSQGLIQDAYVRDNDKLGVVISSSVNPDEVKALTQSLVKGFQRNAPNRDLTVLVYSPNKKLLLTARYNASNRQIDYAA